MLAPENGNYHFARGLYRDSGKENGNYHIRLGLYGDIMEKKMKTNMLILPSCITLRYCNTILPRV